MTPPPPNSPAPAVSDGADKLINEMADVFLSWPLPESVCTDLCSTEKGKGRIGTNLLTFTESRAMFREVVGPILDRETTAILARATSAEAEVERLKARIETLELAGDVVAKMAKLVTRDDGIDPEAHHIELNQEEAHLIQSVAEQVEIRSNPNG